MDLLLAWIHFNPNMYKLFSVDEIIYPFMKPLKFGNG